MSEKKPDVSQSAINKRLVKENIKLKKRLDEFMAPILFGELFKPDSIFDFCERNMQDGMFDFAGRASINQDGQMYLVVHPDGVDGETVDLVQDVYEDYHRDIVSKYSRAIQKLTEVTKERDELRGKVDYAYPTLEDYAEMRGCSVQTFNDSFVFGWEQSRTLNSIFELTDSELEG